MLYLNAQEIRATISMKESIRVMQNLFLLDQQSDLINPLRTKMNIPNGALMGMMPAYIKPYQVMGIKIICIFPKNKAQGLSSHCGIVHLFDAENGTLKISLDADEVTAMRTAAVSALMTDLLAIDKAEVLALVGSGTQAESHLEAILEIRPIKKVTVWSPTSTNVEAFIERQKKKYNLEFEGCANPKLAVQDADIVCTLTASSEPLLERAWLKAGVHINVVGASTPNARELSSEIILEADLYVDSYDAACIEAGDLILSLGSPENIMDKITGDIHETLINKSQIDKNRTSVFKSLGLGIEDVAFAHYCYEKNKLKNNENLSF